MRPVIQPSGVLRATTLFTILISTGGASVFAQQAVRVTRASDFLDSIGTQSAISVRGETFPKTIECVKYLGVRWMRGGIEGNVPLAQIVQMHNETGVRFSWGLGSGGSDLTKLLDTARQVAAAGALLSFEGPNEPNNWGIKYKGEVGGRNQSWAPVAELMRDLYREVKADPELKRYPVWSITENGAETDNVGLQFLTIPAGANATLPPGTKFADFANVHNYFYHPNSPNVDDNKTWKAADPGPACRVDGLYGEYGRTWAKHYQGYTEQQLLTLPRVTTETGCTIDGAITEEIQGLNLVSLYLDQYKRGWSYTCNYLMRDRVDEGGNQSFGYFRPDYTPRKGAVYLHNLTTILADTGRQANPGSLDYSITPMPETVHDMLLQKSDGTFELVVWDERVKGEDTVSISLGRSYPSVNIYDVTQSAAPFAAIPGISHLSLTLTNHPIIIELPGEVHRPRPRADGTAFPLKVSANRRYLVDRRNHPYLLAGDVPQSLAVQCSPEEAEVYFTDREKYGFNTLWINAVNAAPYFPDCRTDGSTYDGIKPFSAYMANGSDLAHYDITKPNEMYFERLDRLLELAERHHFLVFLDPIETGQWLATLRNNGSDAARKYGEFLGARYKRFNNILWLNGNDFDAWKGSAGDDAVVQAVAKGIHASSPDQMQTVELNGDQSLQDPAWRPLISVNGCYTYGVTYRQMLDCYHQNPPMPAYMLESHYENEDVGSPSDFGTPIVVRRQAYWAMLCGACGQLYGNMYTWRLQSGWKQHIDTPGADQFKVWKAFFAALPWYDLVPDDKHAALIDGFGAIGDGATRVSHSQYATAATTSKRDYLVLYMPTSRTVTINMACLRAASQAHWFDPTSGSYTPATAERIPNSGSHVFTLPGKNSAGEGDWVLVLHAG